MNCHVTFQALGGQSSPPGGFPWEKGDGRSTWVCTVPFDDVTSLLRQLDLLEVGRAIFAGPLVVVHFQGGGYFVGVRAADPGDLARGFGPEQWSLMSHASSQGWLPPPWYKRLWRALFN